VGNALALSIMSIARVLAGAAVYRGGGPALTGLLGGQVERVGKHEGFRWIQRKHFYPRELND
jgi:hypothetical protein